MWEYVLDKLTTIHFFNNENNTFSNNIILYKTPSYWGAKVVKCMKKSLAQFFAIYSIQASFLDMIVRFYTCFKLYCTWISFES